MLVSLRGWIPELLELHLDNLETLWHQRVAMAWSSVHHAWDLQRVDRRLLAHADALLLAGEAAFPVLGKGLTGETAGMVGGAAHVLLLGQTHARSVVGLLPTAEGAVAEGLLLALRTGPIDAVREDLRAHAAGGDERVAALAAQVLACHGEADPAVRLATRRMASVTPTSADAAGLCSLWSLAAGRAPASGALATWLRGATRAEHAAVRREAWRAAAWTRQSWLLGDLRDRAASDAEALLLLGILGEPQDLPRLLTASRQTQLGTTRWFALGAFGHPGGVDALAAAMAASDQRAAVAAGAAFQRLSGVSPWSPTRIELPAADTDPGDSLAREFAAGAHLPTAQIATDWRQGPGAGATTRLVGGRDLDARLRARDHADLALGVAADLRLLSHFRSLAQELPGAPPLSA